MTDLDLSAELQEGDVLVSSRGFRWTVTGRSPRGKLVGGSDHGTTASWWWRYRASLPKGWVLERGGVVIR